MSHSISTDQNYNCLQTRTITTEYDNNEQSQFLNNCVANTSNMGQQIIQSLIADELNYINNKIELESILCEFSLHTTLSILINDSFFFVNNPPKKVNTNFFVLDIEPKSTIFFEQIMGHVKQKSIAHSTRNKFSLSTFTNQKQINNNKNIIHKILFSKNSKKRISEVLPEIPKKIMSQNKKKSQQEKAKIDKHPKINDNQLANLTGGLVSLILEQQDKENRIEKYLRYVKGEHVKLSKPNDSIEEQNYLMIGSQFNEEDFRKAQYYQNIDPQTRLKSIKTKKTIVLGKIYQNKYEPQFTRQNKQGKQNKSILLPYQNCFSVKQGILSTNSFSYTIDQLSQIQHNAQKQKQKTINRKSKQKQAETKSQLYEKFKTLPVPASENKQNKQNCKLPQIILKKSVRQEQKQQSIVSLWKVKKFQNKQHEQQLMNFHKNNRRQCSVHLKADKNQQIFEIPSLESGNQKLKIKKLQLKKQKLMPRGRKNC